VIVTSQGWRHVYDCNILQDVPGLDDLLTGLTGFEWDDGNSTKNWERHRVTQAEAEEVFFNQPVIVMAAKPADREIRYNVLGRTNNDRLLSVVFTVRRGLARPVSARPMSRKERTAYAEISPEIP
jgi:uncharacterized DUF497 family protein